MSGKPAPEEGGEEQKKGSPIIKYAILGVIVVLLGAGGYIGYVKFLKPPPAEEAGAEGGGGHGGGGGTQGGGSAKKEADKKLIHEWDPFLVNLADLGGKRYLKLTMKLELFGGKVQEEIAERNFEMRDAVLMLLSSKEFEDISTAPGKVRLKQDIVARLNKILKNGQVKEIYFTDFIVQ